MALYKCFIIIIIIIIIIIMHQCSSYLLCCVNGAVQIFFVVINISLLRCDALQDLWTFRSFPIRRFKSDWDEIWQEGRFSRLPNGSIDGVGRDLDF